MKFFRITTRQDQLIDVSTPHVPADIATDAIETAEIKDGAVIAAKIGTDAVVEAKVQAGAITVNKIGAGAVTAAKIAADAITKDKLGIITTKGDILNFGTEPLRLGIGTNDHVLTADSGETSGMKWAAAGGGGAGAGGHVLIKPYAYSNIVQGTWTWYNHNTVIPDNVVFSTTGGAGDGDELNFTCYLDAGNYKLIIAHAVQNAAAIVDFYVDGTERMELDCYAGSSTWGNVITSAQFSIGSAGIKTVRMVVDGKNGSSSGYQCIIYSIIIYRVS